VGVPLAVADDDSVNEVELTTATTVAPFGIPVPETVAPAKKPRVLGTETVFDVATTDVVSVVPENMSAAVTRR
jgi:hypothetical protein